MFYQYSKVGNSDLCKYEKEKHLYVLFILSEDRMENIKMKQNEGCVEME